MQHPATSSGDIICNQKSELLLQENRRKTLRRAANRRSAQLSRARKKSHLEEMKIENSRLQRLVDILDSQPELVFCLTADGRVSQITSRSETFMKINMSGDLSDEVPTHVNQILCKESVDSLLAAIDQLMTLSPQDQNDSNMLFSAKEVYFHDAFGYPLVGSLRCSKVIRRTTLRETQNSEESIMDSDNLTSGSFQSSYDSQIVAKKARTNSSISSGNSSSSGGNSSSNNSSSKSIHKVEDLSKVDDFRAIDTKTNPEGWMNCYNFKLLTDCALLTMVGDETPLDTSSELATHTAVANASITIAATSAGTNCLDSRVHGNRITSKSSVRSNGKGTEVRPPNEELLEGQDDVDEVEFVCVIRTSDDCFAPHSSSSSGREAHKNANLLLFSSQLSTASMVAHDLEQRVTSNNGQKNRSQSCDDSEENSEENNLSSNSSGHQPNSDGSKQRNSTSSETCSDENMESVSSESNSNNFR